MGINQGVEVPCRPCNRELLIRGKDNSCEAGSEACLSCGMQAGKPDCKTLYWWTRTTYWGGAGKDKMARHIEVQNIANNQMRRCSSDRGQICQIPPCLANRRIPAGTYGGACLPFDCSQAGERVGDTIYFVSFPTRLPAMLDDHPTTTIDDKIETEINKRFKKQCIVVGIQQKVV